MTMKILTVCLLSIVVYAQNPISQKFPSSIVTDQDLGVAPYNATYNSLTGVVTTLTASVDAVVLSFSVVDNSIALYSVVTVDNERLMVCSKSTGVLTMCARGYGGSTASSHTIGAKIYSYVDPYSSNALRQAVKDIQIALGINLAGISNYTLPSLTLSDGSNDGYVKVCPLTDSAHCFTFKSPSSRSTDLIVRMPTTDPVGTQYLACGSPSGGVSTCSWDSPGSMVYPSAGLPISSGSAWSTSLTPGSSGNVVRSNGTIYADSQLSFSDLGGNPTSAQTLAGFSGTKDSSHCTAGDGTMVACSGGSSANATMTIDLPAGGVVSGGLNSVWDLASGGGGGNSIYHAIDLVSSGTPSYKATFRLPANFDKTKTVSVLATGGNSNGVSGNVRLNVQIGCYVAGQSLLSDPTYGAAASISITQPGTNVASEGSASSLTLAMACDSGKMARVLLSRDNTIGSNLADVYSVHDIALNYGTK